MLSRSPALTLPPLPTRAHLVVFERVVFKREPLADQPGHALDLGVEMRVGAVNQLLVLNKKNVRTGAHERFAKQPPVVPPASDTHGHDVSGGGVRRVGTAARS